MSAYGDIAAAGTQMAISGLQAYSSKNRGTGKYTDTDSDYTVSGEGVDNIDYNFMSFADERFN